MATRKQSDGILINTGFLRSRGVRQNKFIPRPQRRLLRKLIREEIRTEIEKLEVPKLK